MRNEAGNVILYRLIPICEMMEKKNTMGELTNQGTTADLIGMTNQVEFDVVKIRGKEFHIFNRTI